MELTQNNLQAQFNISIFYFLLKKPKKYRSNNIIDELNFFRKLLLTIKIFRS